MKSEDSPRITVTVTVTVTYTVWLCERLVLTYTNPGEVVLDCCAGSASIGVACCRTGRRYIGIENEKQYYDVMRTRLRECCRSHSKEVG